MMIAEVRAQRMQPDGKVQRGYAKAVLERIVERWPELAPKLIANDITNLMTSLWPSACADSWFHAYYCTAAAGFRAGLVLLLTLPAGCAEGIPSEREARLAVEAAEAAQAEQNAVQAERLSSVPKADASWEELHQFMKQVETDMAAGGEAMTKWTANATELASAAFQRSASWKLGKTMAQQKVLAAFIRAFRCAVSF